MCKNLISLSMAVTLLLCPACQTSHAANNEETARKIAAIFAEEEEKAQQKLNLEASKRQKLENENKALLEELRNLKAEKENKELQNEIEKLKANNKKTSSQSTKPVSGARGVLRLILGASGIGVIGAACAYIIEIIKATLECSKDKWCKSYREKLDKAYIFDLTTWHNLSTGVYNIASICKRFLDDRDR